MEEKNALRDNSKADQFCLRAFRTTAFARDAIEEPSCRLVVIKGLFVVVFAVECVFHNVHELTFQHQKN